jgi:hypothetical protein
VGPVVIPESLLPHLVDILTPGQTTDRYGNTVDDWTTATRAEVRAWVQQQTGSELTDLRSAQIGQWVLLCNPRTTDGAVLAVPGNARIQWTGYGITFEVDGPPGPAYEPSELHHYEVRLKVVEG